VGGDDRQSESSLVMREIAVASDSLL